MARYTDSMAGYADWQSSGRGFAAASAGALAIGAVAWFAGNGRLGPLSLPFGEGFFTTAIGYVGLGLASILAFAAAGSALVTRRSKATIDITDHGVTRSGPGDELSLSRAEILGMVEIPGRRPRGSMLLVTADAKRGILISNSLENYGSCLDELRRMGIPVLPSPRRSRLRSFAAWLAQIAGFSGLMLIVPGTRPLLLRVPHVEMIVGGLLVVCLSAWVFSKARSIRRFNRPWR